MSGQLIGADILEDVPAAVRPAVTWAAVIAVGYAAVGAACGWIWASRYTAPSGVVYDHTWYPDEWDAGQRTIFAATGSFVVIAAIAGLVLGLAAVLIPRATEVPTLVGVIVGSVLATGLMLWVGLQLGPSAPAAAAATAADGTALDGGLTTPGWAAWTALPLASLVVLCVVYLMVPARAAGDSSDEE
ncbi:hypothetical protein [Nocardioides sp.]|uniref:hypothetical protein n=1 Tax=Nocardioides sp. TaxID=35761 RepID=UPI0039E46950